MVTARPSPDRGAVEAVLRSIDDPEMPISIVDLGIVERVAIEDGAVAVDVIPTFVGCPALDMIRDEIVARLGRVEGVAAVAVRFIHDPPWSPDRISVEGRARLREHGVTVPERVAAPELVPLTQSAVPCPFCGSRSTRRESPFGPTRCRSIWYCDACRNGFEHLRRAGA